MTSHNRSDLRWDVWSELCTDLNHFNFCRLLAATLLSCNCVFIYYCFCIFYRTRIVTQHMVVEQDSFLTCIVHPKDKRSHFVWTWRSIVPYVWNGYWNELTRLGEYCVKQDPFYVSTCCTITVWFRICLFQSNMVPKSPLQLRSSDHDKQRCTATRLTLCIDWMFVAFMRQSCTIRKAQSEQLTINAMLSDRLPDGVDITVYSRDDISLWHVCAAAIRAMIKTTIITLC